jgi:hypothetical protein
MFDLCISPTRPTVSPFIELSSRSFDKKALLLKIEAIRSKEQEAANLVEIERKKKS